MPYELLEVKRDVCLMLSHTYMYRTMHETDNTVLDRLICILLVVVVCMFT